MPLASGLGSSLGGAKEASYGTPVTPNRFLEYDSETFNRVPTYQESVGLRANRTFQPAGRTKQTTRSANGGFACDVPTKGFGWVLDLMNGLTNAPVQQGVTPAYLLTVPIGTSLPNKTATIQVNRPDLTGTDRPFTYDGQFMTGWSFALDLGGLWKFTATFIGRDEVTTTALAPATYAAGIASFDHTQVTVLTLGGNPLGSVRSISLSHTQPVKDDRWYIGSGALRAKPIPNGFTDVTGSITIDFDGMAAYDHFRSGAFNRLVSTTEGAVIAGTERETFGLDASALQVRGDTPNVDGPDVLTQTVPFVLRDSGTDAPLTVTYKSVDSAL